MIGSAVAPQTCTLRTGGGQDRPCQVSVGDQEITVPRAAASRFFVGALSRAKPNHDRSVRTIRTDHRETDTAGFAIIRAEGTKGMREERDDDTESRNRDNGRRM